MWNKTLIRPNFVVEGRHFHLLPELWGWIKNNNVKPSLSPQRWRLWKLKVQPRAPLTSALDNGVVNFTLRPLYPREKKPFTYWIGDWLGFRACLGVLHKKQDRLLLYRESNQDIPVVQYPLYRLYLLDSQLKHEVLSVVLMILHVWWDVTPCSFGINLVVSEVVKTLCSDCLSLKMETLRSFGTLQCNNRRCLAPERTLR